MNLLIAIAVLAAVFLIISKWIDSDWNDDL